MEFTPEFQKKIQLKMKRDIKNALVEVAKEITEEVRNYVYKQIYLKPSSLYYDRDGYDGGFISTFDPYNSTGLIDNMLRTQGNKIYITFLLRNYEDLSYQDTGWGWGSFGHHTSFDGVKTKNDRFSSVLDTFINEGWDIHGRNGQIIKTIEGIHFKEYAKDLVET